VSSSTFDDMQPRDSSAASTACFEMTAAAARKNEKYSLDASTAWRVLMPNGWRNVETALRLATACLLSIR
jgi:hypothetical protein